MKKLFSIKEAIIFIIENSRLRSEFNQENYTISEYHNTLIREIEENTNKWNTTLYHGLEGSLL